MAIPALAVACLFLKSFSAWACLFLAASSADFVLAGGNCRKSRVLTRTSSITWSSRPRRSKGLIMRFFERRPRICFRLDHLLPGFRQIGLGLAQVVFLRGGIGGRLHHYVSRLHQLASSLSEVMGRSPPTYHGAVSTSELPPCNSPRAETGDRADFAFPYARGQDFISVFRSGQLDHAHATPGQRRQHNDHQC